MESEVSSVSKRLFVFVPVSDFVLWFILSGTALYDRPHSVPSQKVFEGDAISLINAGQEGIGAAFRDPSLDFSLLEVRLPSEISGS